MASSKEPRTHVTYLSLKLPNDLINDADNSFSTLSIFILQQISAPLQEVPSKCYNHACLLLKSSIQPVKHIAPVGNPWRIHVDTKRIAAYSAASADRNK